MIELIMNDIWIVAKQFVLDAIITTSMVMFDLYILHNIIYKDTSSMTTVYNRRKLILIYALHTYLYIVASITFISREPSLWYRVNLRPLGTVSLDFYENRQLIENVLLFIPFGFLIPLLWSNFNSMIKCMGAGFILSLAIEVSQYLTKRGSFQIDDIITNLIGIMIGFGIVHGLRIIRRSLIGI